jgi:hypothetical protein
MTSHIRTLATDSDQLRQRYDALRNRGLAEVDHQKHSCVGCQVIERNRNLCQNSKDSVEVCLKCCDTGKQPCGKLICHPTGAGFAIGFLPLPAEHRGGKLWAELDYWVRPYDPSRKPQSKPSKIPKRAAIKPPSKDAPKTRARLSTTPAV